MSTVSNRTAFAEKVRTAGVVGSGGAGFPTHIKLKNRCGTLIVNGAECEPLLENDRYLLETEAERIAEAAGMAAGDIGAREIIVGIKKKNSRAVEEMRRVLESAVRRGAAVGAGSARIAELENFYPAGDEHVLVYETTGRIVPEGGIPLSVDAVVFNVETLLNIFHAVRSGTPVTERTLTCTGEVRRPKVVRAAVGTPIDEVIALCGGTPLDEPAVILGGPLMGRVVTDLKTPVDKLTGGVIVLDRNHPVIVNKTLPLETILKRSRSVCCQCTACTDLCPRGLLGHDSAPHLMMRLVNYGLDMPAQFIGRAFLCSECGLCEVFVCPMGVSPSAVNRAVKLKLRDGGFSPRFEPKTPEVCPDREYRKVPAEKIVERLHLAGYSEGVYSRGEELFPGYVELPLQQHIGPAALPVVGEGDRVRKGDVVGEAPEHTLGARVHASISGKVVRADEERIVILDESN